MTRRLAGFVIAGLAVAVVTIPAKASDPIDTYCMVEKVVFEPEDCPDRAQIWGACARVNRRTAGTTSASRRYFYSAVPTGREEAARAEWMDQKSVAGKDQDVGVGGLRGPQARYRGTAEKPAAPTAVSVAPPAPAASVTSSSTSHTTSSLPPLAAMRPLGSKDLRASDFGAIAARLRAEGFSAEMPS